MYKKNILVLGSGLSGVGAVKLAKHFNYNVRVSSLNRITKKNKKLFLNLGVLFEELGNTFNYLKWSSLIIKSPGVPQNAIILKEARLREIPIISEIEFAFRHSQGKIIAITGTNGKTTTSTLLHFILKNAGLNAHLSGNIGKSFSESVLQHKVDYHILELSSFQLEDIKSFHPHIAILLNIEKDHMDYYDNNFQSYVQSKLKIQMNQTRDDHFIYFQNGMKTFNKYLKKVQAKRYSFGHNNLAIEDFGAWCENNKLTIKTIKNQFTMTIHNLALQGTHNLYNSMAASIAASTLGIKKDIIKKSLSDFKGVEHRLELVAKVSGVTFINDSKATNCNSVYYALESVRDPIIWICGGIDKGNDYSILKQLVVNKVKSIILLGKNGDKIKTIFKEDVESIFETNNMNEAVKHSFSIAHAGETVLLSPACASFDLFNNYEERGRMFKDCVFSI